MKIYILLCLISLSFIFSHRTVRDNLPRNKVCLGDVSPTPISWHLHVIFDPMDHDLAYSVREKAANYLGIDLKAQKDSCRHLIYPMNLDICYFEPVDHPEEDPDATPFVNSEFAFLFYPKDFYKIVTWFLLNREGLDLYIHPNTGCDISDHTSYVIEVGLHRRTRPEIFTREGNPVLPLGFKHFLNEKEVLESPQVSENVKRFLRKSQF